jgi:hypothetical protein
LFYTSCAFFVTALTIIASTSVAAPGESSTRLPQLLPNADKASGATAPRGRSAYPKPREIYAGKRRFVLTERTNELGEYEVEIKLREEWTFAPDTRRAVLVGRSIDGDERADVWFTLSETGVIRYVKRQQTERDPWPAALSVIQNELDIDDRWFSWVALETVGKAISIAVARNRNFFEDIKREQMNLFDLELRTNTLERKNPKDPQIPIAREMILVGWESVFKRIDNEMTRDYWMYLAGDIGVSWAATGAATIIAKWLGRATVTFENSPYAKGDTAKAVRELYARFKESLAEKISQANAKMPLFRRGAGAQAAATLARLGGGRWTIGMRIEVMIASYEARSRLARAIIKSLRQVYLTAAAGAKSYKYVLLTPPLQTVSEIIARPEDLFDPNPIVMVDKLRSDQEFVQNFAYMTNEAFWMAALHSRFRHQPVKAIALCAAVGAADSIAMNLIFRSSPDPVRVAIDSGWEMTVGNGQTLIDGTVITYFEGLAKKNSNPNLRFVGYIVALFDQAAGFWGYSKATNAYTIYSANKGGNGAQPTSEPDSKSQAPAQQTVAEVRLIPVLAEVAP